MCAGVCAMFRGRRRKGRAILARPLAVLLFPLAALPLLASCAAKDETRSACDRTVSCKEKRPLPILY